MWFWLKISICESSVVHEGCCVNCSTRVGNLEAVGLLKRIRNTGTIVWQPGSDRPCLAHISRGPCAQLGGQAKKAQISSWYFAWNRHSLFKCAQDNKSAKSHCKQTVLVQLIFYGSGGYMFCGHSIYVKFCIVYLVRTNLTVQHSYKSMEAFLSLLPHSLVQ